MNLDELTGNTEQYSLTDLVPQSNIGLQLPSNAVKTRAAKTALLTSDPSKMTEDYQVYVAEGEQGRSDAVKQAQERLFQAQQTKDIQGAMSVLSDPLLTLDEKRSVIDYIRNAPKDTNAILLSESLIKESGEETPDQEEARMAAANWLDEINQEAYTRQGIVNAHAAGLSGEAGDAFVGMLEQWVAPFGNTADSFKLYKGFKEAAGQKMTGWDAIKALALPGTNKAEIRDFLSSLPPAQRTVFTQQLIDVIKSSSGIVLNDNQFAQYEKADQLFGSGYSSTEEFLDNVTPLLDAIGIGQAMRAGSRLLKGEKAAVKAVPVPTEAPKPTAAPSPEDGVAPPAANPVFEELPPQPTEAPLPPGSADMPKKPQEGVSTLLGGTGKKVEEPQKKVAALLRRTEINNTVARENPTSAAKTVQQVNPESARALHASVAKSEGGAVAEGLYGTSKMDALASDTMPQVALADGRVTTRPTDIERNLRTELDIPEQLVDILYSNGRLDITPAELARAKANVVRNFENAEGMTLNNSMSSFSEDGGQIKISAVYGTPEGGFTLPEEAIDRAKIALRSYGIRADEIVLLEKQGMDHVPVTLDEVKGKKGNYMVRVETAHDVDAFDLVDEAGNLQLEKLDVKRNWLDRISPWIPLVQDPARHVLDAASMLHSQLTGAASVTTNLISRLDKFLLDLAADYSDRWGKLKKNEKVMIDQYVREANYNRIAFDQTDLLARGFTPEMVETVRAWRKFWDSHFYLENYDLVRTMNAQGYQLFSNASTTLYVKPVRKVYTIAGEINQAGTGVDGGKKIYNPATGALTRLTKDEIDDLYNTGGYLAKLRRPTDFGGEVTDMMMIRNTPTEYSRKFRDTDQVLNYINGYFQIQYSAPRFVDEISATGTRAIAVAGDWKEAEAFAESMRKNNPGVEYKVRGDDRALQRGSDDWWDVNSAQGRIAQRHRGKLLEDGSGMNHLGNSTSYILDPVDSAVRAARSIAGRVITRPVIEQAKVRAIQQYGHLFPSDGMGGRKWPASFKDIGEKGDFTSKELSDARTTVNYINYLENGYINGIDNLVKATLNAFSQSIGKAGFARTERAIHVASETQGGPVSFLRGTASNMLLFWNPLRQLLVQGHQGIRAFGYNPQGFVTGKVQELILAYNNQKLGMPFNYTKEQKEFFSFVEESGLITNIDRQNLVRGTLSDASQASNRVTRTFSKANAFMRKVGFDLGETLNRSSHAAAVYDLFKRQGKDVTNKRVKAEMISKIDALGYDMNFAGDMPYNQTSASVMLQFMQVPHKALTQFLNRRLTKAERFRMAITDMMLFGTPAVWVADMMGVDILQDEPELRDLVKNGAESIVLNSFFTWLSGEKTNIDFSSLSPYSASGWAEFFAEMRQDGPLSPTMIINSPAGSIYFKDGGKLDNILTISSKYFEGFYDPNVEPSEFMDIVKEVAKLSSGWSNALKMKAALELKAHYEKYGLQAIDPEVNTAEAFAQLFGFTTKDLADYYSTSKKLYDTSKSHRDEVLNAYNDIKKFYSENENSPVDRVQKISGAVLKMFDDDPVARQIIAEQLKRDLRNPNEKILYQILKGAGVPDAREVRNIVLDAPISDEQKQKALEFLDETAKASEQMIKE